MTKSGSNESAAPSAVQMIRDLCLGRLDQICDKQLTVGSSPMGNSLSSANHTLLSGLILTGGSAYWRLLEASFPAFPQSAYGGGC